MSLKQASKLSSGPAKRDASSRDSNWHLRLYVAGTTEKSVRAIAAVKGTCEQYLRGRYELKVIDLYQQPDEARDEQVIAAPTLIKKLPLPLRRLTGDMTNRRRLLAGLDIAIGPSNRAGRPKTRDRAQRR